MEGGREGVDGGGGAEGGDEDMLVEHLTEKQINEVSQAVETFGIDLVSRICHESE